MSLITSIEAILDASDTAGPIEEGDIAEAERLMGTSFPPCYREFLSRFGAALCNGFEIAGIFDHPAESVPPYWTGVVTSYQQLHRAVGCDLPANYIPISDDGGDYFFYLDGSDLRAGGECPVVVLGPGRDGEVVADSFSEFVLLRSRNELEY